MSTKKKPKQRLNQCYRGVISKDIYFSDHKLDLHIITGDYRGRTPIYSIMNLKPISLTEALNHPELKGQTVIPVP